jgi:hypothetical protein
MCVEYNTIYIPFTQYRVGISARSIEKIRILDNIIGVSYYNIYGVDFYVNKLPFY